MLRLLVQIAGLFVVFGASPATYPYENESFVPVDMVASTPSYTFDDKDVGGYMYTHTLNFVIKDEDIPFCFMRTGMAQYLIVNKFGAPPHYGTSQTASWNCTAKGLKFASADFTGTIAGNSVCTAGECCSFVYDIFKFGDDQLTWHSWLDDRSDAGLCEAINENTYCLLSGGDTALNCMEVFVAPETRLAVWTCPQSVVLYMMSCKVFKTEYTRIYLTEPPMYVDSSSIAENMANDAFSKAQDKMCHPHSYFFPEDTASKLAGDDDSSSNTLSGIIVAVSCFLFLL